MDTLGRGIIAGFIATLALSVALDPMIAASRLADVLPRSLAWVLHFFVGSFVWGAGFALLQPLLRGPYWLRGLQFGVLAWLLVTLAIMPLTRAGFFGLQLGIAAPVFILLVHIAYGGLLGGVFGLLGPRNGTTAKDAEPTAKPDNLLHPLHR